MVACMPGKSEVRSQIWFHILVLNFFMFSRDSGESAESTEKNPFWVFLSNFKLN